MHTVRNGAGAIALIAVLLCGSGLTTTAAADSAGTVHFVRSADSAFDRFTSSPSPSEQAWLQAHMWRMTVWSPYFDSRTSWYPNGWVYDDAYAIYTGEPLASQHPEWILRDAQGNKLYIPWGCSGGSCPQYAADISNPAFRRYWIEDLVARAARGYRGVFIDDVNMNRQVSNGQEELVAPIDSNTNQPMSDAAWRQYMAQFMRELRAALPNAEIVRVGAPGGLTSTIPPLKSRLSRLLQAYRGPLASPRLTLHPAHQLSGVWPPPLTASPPLEMSR